MMPDTELTELSPREKQILKYAAEGLIDTAIAHNLGISEATVGTYWGRVRAKLGAHSRTELVAIMMRTTHEAAIESLKRENAHLVEALHAEAKSAENSQFYALLEEAADALLLVNGTGMISFSNRSAHELFGYSEGELAGQSLSLLVPERYREEHIRHMKEYVDQPERHRMNDHQFTPGLRKDGTEFGIRAMLSASTKGDDLVVLCAIRTTEDD